MHTLITQAEHSHCSFMPVQKLVGGIVFILLMFPAICHAGHYQRISQSGGVAELQTSKGSKRVPYHRLPSGGYGVFAKLDSKGFSSIRCSGVITSVYEWVPSEPSDDPPNQAILKTSCSAWWQVRGTDTQGFSSNDLGFDELNFSCSSPKGDQEFATGMVTGVRYDLIPGGSRIVARSSPFAEVIGFDSTSTAGVDYEPDDDRKSIKTVEALPYPWRQSTIRSPLQELSRRPAARRVIVYCPSLAACVPSTCLAGHYSGVVYSSASGKATWATDKDGGSESYHLFYDGSFGGRSFGDIFIFTINAVATGLCWFKKRRHGIRFSWMAV
jgi:hypothetical protein